MENEMQKTKKGKPGGKSKTPSWGRGQPRNPPLDSAYAFCRQRGNIRVRPPHWILVMAIAIMGSAACLRGAREAAPVQGWMKQNRKEDFFEDPMKNEWGFS